MCGIVIALGSEPLGIRITFPIISANLINNAWTTCDPLSRATYENQIFVYLYGSCLRDRTIFQNILALRIVISRYYYSIPLNNNYENNNGRF